MSTSPISSFTDANSALNGANANTKDQANQIAKTFDNFLKLLTTQLKNQDPLDPMKSAEFTNQLVQFSQVEQQINLNAKFDKLLAMQESNAVLGAAGYIGRELEVQTDVLVKESAFPVQAYFADKATTATIEIRDASTNALVRTITKNNVGAGMQTFHWDGRNAGGDLMPTGNYRVAVAAVDFNNNPVKVDVPTTTVALNTVNLPRFAYAFGEKPAKAEAEILDKNGSVVRKIGLEVSNGRKEVVWDGRTFNEATKTYAAAEPGEYKVRIKSYDDKGNLAKGKDGKPLEPALATVVKVRDVRTAGGGAQLLVGADTYISMEQVVAVRS